MFRLIITILACFMFLVFGLLGEDLLNIIPQSYRRGVSLPPITDFVVRSFQKWEWSFLNSAYLFCAAMLVMLLLTSSKKPLLAPHYFWECALIILILFAIYFGCIAVALTLPFISFLVTASHQYGMPDSTPHGTVLNIVITILNYTLWIATFVLLARLIVNRFKKAK